jgi:hypothetical protein
MGLFTKKSKVYSIQINDEKINKEICNLIMHLKQNISEFMNLLEGRFLGDKDEKVDEILKIFSRLAEDIKTLMLDVQQIQNIELQKKEFIRIQDEQFVIDKVNQLTKIKEIIQQLMDMLHQRPTDKEFKEELLKVMIQDVNDIIEAINKILIDDDELSKVYKGIDNM